MVEITVFRLEIKSCKYFFLNKFSTNESTRIYNRLGMWFIIQLILTNSNWKPPLIHSWSHLLFQTEFCRVFLLEFLENSNAVCKIPTKKEAHMYPHLHKPLLVYVLLNFSVWFIIKSGFKSRAGYNSIRTVDDAFQLLWSELCSGHQNSSRKYIFKWCSTTVWYVMTTGLDKY